MNLSGIVLLFAVVGAYARVQGGKNEIADVAYPTVSATSFSISADSNGMSVLLHQSLRSMAAANNSSAESNTTTPAVEQSDFNDNNQGPIFGTWEQEQISYSGRCDLVLLENHGFNNDLGMDIHIRTQKTNQQWTYLSNAAVRIGKDTLEVVGGKGGTSQYWINGVNGKTPKKDGVLRARLSGYPIEFRRVNNKQVEYVVDLGNDEMIVMQTWNDIVRVDIIDATDDNFGSSRGLMGDFESGLHMARDSRTELKDSDAFVQEWQVLNSERKLFRTHQSCESPSSPAAQEKQEQQQPTGNTVVTQNEAESACANVGEEDFQMCVFDVMAINDVRIASAY